MIDIDDLRPQTRLRDELAAAREAGSWMPWAGASLAVLLWGGIGAWLFASVGFAAVMAQPPVVLAGGLAAIIAPGIALIAAGIMARETTRSSHANAIVLQSAKHLLEPAETTRSEVSSIAQAISRETGNVNRTLADARQRLDDIKREIETSATSALKAAEIVRTDSEVLIHKMSSERLSMSQLAESLRNQSESLAKAIPRHAQMMSEAAREAQVQVANADTTLGQRLRDLEDTAKDLAQRISQLDNMGGESRKRAQNLAGVLTRLDEQLTHSTRMVESASQAGELAAAAAKSTAESLRDAMSDALDSALKATETINSRSAQAADDAQQAMQRLKEAGLQAETITRGAALAARAQADETEQRVAQLAEFLFRATTNATDAVESGLERARERIEKASLLLGQIRGEKEQASSRIDDLILEPQPEQRKPLELRPIEPKLVAPRLPPEPKQPEYKQPEYRQPEYRQPEQKPLDLKPVDDDFILDRPVARPPALDLFRPAPKPTASGEFTPATRNGNGNGHGNGNGNGGAPNDELILNHLASLQRPSAPQPPAPKPNAPSSQQQPYDPFFDGPSPPQGASGAALSWRELLTGMDDVPLERREATAGAMVDRLDRAGIHLGIVKASDLRRIASASHQGERHRRRAIRDIAPGEIQRVSRLLDADSDLNRAARTFITSEEPDALRVLAGAERAREDAHPRLSAYLLLDAALGATM